MPRPDPWFEITRPYPANASLAERLRFLLNFAVVAPSSHNTQPWVFSIVDDGVDLYADRTRGLSVVDPFDRELTISCGAALFHLRVAMEAHGFAPAVELLPDPDDAELLARIRVVGRPTTAVDDPRLLPAVVDRRTNRRGFDARPVPAYLLAELEKAAQAEGAWLWVATDDAKSLLADLVAEADRRQWEQPAFRRELASWVVPNRAKDRCDGIPGYAQGIGDVLSAVGPVVVRTFDLGRGSAARDRQLAEQSPALAVLWTEGDTPLDWLHAGQALGRVLLRARADYVWASFLNQPVECVDLRPALADVVHGDHPQLVLRLGFGVDVPPTPRRPVDDVVV